MGMNTQSLMRQITLAGLDTRRGGGMYISPASVQDLRAAVVNAVLGAVWSVPKGQVGWSWRQIGAHPISTGGRRSA